MIQLELQFVGLTKRQCPVCGKEVVGQVNKVYCSRRCQHKAYLQANREKVRERQKAYYQANREQYDERRRVYRQTNREQYLEKSKAYYQANRERCLEQARAYKKANRERLNERRKAYYWANREKERERCKAYHKANPERHKAKEHRRRARKKANGVEPTAEHRNTMANPLTHQVCHYCGKDCTGDFHWDHFIPLAKGGPDAPWNLVVSCPTCNLSKSDKLPESVFCDELGLVT